MVTAKVMGQLRNMCRVWHTGSTTSCPQWLLMCAMVCPNASPEKNFST